MKTVFFTDTFLPQINGVTNTLCYFSQYLSQHNIEHIFFTPRYRGETTNEGAYPVVCFPYVPFALYPQVHLALFTTSAIRKRLMEFKPDVVYIVAEFSMPTVRSATPIC